MIEIRNGIQCPVEPRERFQHRSEFDDWLEEQAALTREVQRLKLRSNFTKIAPFLFGQERADMVRAVTVLDAGGFNDGAVVRMLASTDAKVKQLPAQTRSMQLAVIQTRGAAAESRTLEFEASNFEKDRHGTRVDPLGLDTTNFKRNPLFLWNHSWTSFLGTPDMSNVLGKMVDWRATAQSFTVKAEFAPTPRGDEGLALCRGGFLSACSIAFIPKKIEMTMEEGIEVPVIRQADLLEVSLVFVPSLASAGLTGRGRAA